MKQDATAAAGEIKNDADAMAENTEETVKDVFERDGFANVVATDLTSEELTGAPLYDSNDEWIGEVSQINLTNDGKVKSIVADIGGFLGLGEKPVELELSKMDVLRADDGGDLRAYVSMSKEELEQLPDYEQ